MSGRDDVEVAREWAQAVARELWDDAFLDAGFDDVDDLARSVWQSMRAVSTPFLAAHVEAVRVSERVRLAGEAEALARVEALAESGDLPHGVRLALRAALVPVPGVRLTEEE